MCAWSWTSLTFTTWQLSTCILDLLSPGVWACFPVVLTYKYACDESVISFLRSQGNSPTAFQHNLQELHSNQWLQKSVRYRSDCQRHKRGQQALGLPCPVYDTPSPFPRFRHARWFLAVYVREVWSRLPSLKAAITSTYGTVLKMDSTKKVCKKLQGAAVNTASWATNVGNERGEIVMSVLTESEGMEGLQKMADGLVARYRGAGKAPPSLLYTDRYKAFNCIAFLHWYTKISHVINENGFSFLECTTCTKITQVCDIFINFH